MILRQQWHRYQCCAPKMTQGTSSCTRRDDRKKSDPHGMWGKWRNDPLGMPKGRLQSGLKERNRQQELDGARQRLEQAHAQILAMGREGGGEESRGYGGERGGRGGWVRRPESGRPLESMMSGYNLAGGAHPGLLLFPHCHDISRVTRCWVPRPWRASRGRLSHAPAASMMRMRKR